MNAVAQIWYLTKRGNTPAKDIIEKVTSFRAHKLRVLYIAQSRSDLQRQNSDKLIATLEDNCKSAMVAVQQLRRSQAGFLMLPDKSII